ncbi:Cytospin-B Sperm antigen with calponin -like proteiny and coiled-coil domains 1 [Channa argus]|uniref:Cytospin-B Sperm antigen with calponin-like proteiny and coiled-coil domains 1 n=1 Tax=Channa argus TaxID=215402 RepID=A0A6G1QVY6_CHAAH|nr:Cytospin-B Sperm antigen with calponin -like proteiny and coiled-coil domains 1 [Channa argus]
MMKAGTTKVGPPRPGLQKPASLAPSSTSTAMKSSRSSNIMASDQRLSKLKRASSDDALTKPALGTGASGYRMKKTVTTGAISDLAEARPRSLSAALSLNAPRAPGPLSSSETSDPLVSALLFADDLKTNNKMFSGDTMLTLDISKYSSYLRGVWKRPALEAHACAF